MSVLKSYAMFGVASSGEENKRLVGMRSLLALRSQQEPQSIICTLRLWRLMYMMSGLRLRCINLSSCSYCTSESSCDTMSRMILISPWN